MKSKFINEIKNLQRLAGLLKEEDFDLSDNPIPNKVVSSYTYEVPEFEIDLSDKGEHWMVDVEVLNVQYASGKMKWVTKVVKAMDMTGFPNHVIEYNPTTNPEVFKYLENIIRTDKEVADKFDEAFNEVLYSAEEEEEEDDDYEYWDEWERNPER